MWTIRDIKLQPARLDFSSSGQEPRNVTQVVADAEVLANAMELTDWHEPSCQAIVCEECGQDGCQRGGWIAPRWSGQHVLVLPDFADMADDEWALEEYRPPAYCASRGIPVLEAAIASDVPPLEEPERLRALRGAELVQAIQWDAPAGVLGRFPKAAKLRRQDVLAAESGDLEELLDGFERAIELVQHSDAATLRPAGASDEPVRLYLEGPGTIAWGPFVRVGTEWRLSLGAGLVVAER